MFRHLVSAHSRSGLRILAILTVALSSFAIARAAESSVIDSAAASLRDEWVIEGGSQQTGGDEEWGGAPPDGPFCDSWCTSKYGSGWAEPGRTCYFDHGECWMTWTPPTFHWSCYYWCIKHNW